MLLYKIYSLAGKLWHDNLPQAEAHERLTFYEGPDAVASLERFVAGRRWPEYSLVFKKRVFVCVNEAKPPAHSYIAYPFDGPGVFASGQSMLSVAELEMVREELTKVVDLPAREQPTVTSRKPVAGIMAAAFAAALGARR